MNKRVMAIFLTVIVSTGCSTTGDMSKQLARVAKDWCLTIRASQVIPVYPLTEDLQPGDVFLVRTPIEEEVTLFEANGFLPLENLITRQPLTNYAGFYEHAYGIGTNSDTPYHWQFPTDPTVTNGWINAPRAGFPSYTFSVQKGAGVSVALPVNGVPVAMSLLGTGQAHGSVQLSDAYTYGLDMQTVQQRIMAWASAPTNMAFLKQFRSSHWQTNYLRVVNRVYLVKTVNISVTSDQAYSGTASGGAPKAVNLFDTTPSNGGNGLATTSNYLAAISAVSSQLDASLPGGTLKVAAATGRSISMIETFPRPLVVGYIGFDFTIGRGGKLTNPTATWGRLTNRQETEATTLMAAEYDKVNRIMQFVDNNGIVDTTKLTVLVKQTHLGSAWINTYAGKSSDTLRADLEGPDYEYVSALAKGLPSSH